MKQGWIKIQRSLLDWEWYDDINTKVLFLHCLLKANHAEKKYRGAVVKRGTFLTGRELLAKDTGLTVQQIRTSLIKLKSTNELTIKPSSKGSVVEVVNYDKYQSTTNTATNEQPTSNQQVTSNKNEKKEKNEKKFSPPSEAEFIQYLQEAMPKVNSEWTSHRINIAAGQQFETYVGDGWKDGFGNAIKNWKNKAKNCLTAKKPWNYGTKKTTTKFGDL